MDGRRRFSQTRLSLNRIISALVPRACFTHKGEVRSQFTHSRLHALHALSPQGTGAGAVLTRYKNRYLNRSNVVLPLAQRLPRHIGTYFLAGFFSCLTAYGSVKGGHVEAFQAQHGAFHEAAARFVGFGVEYITLSGLSGLSEAEFIAATGLNGRETLPFLKAELIQARLEALPRVREATVRKLYPHGLLVEVVERQPFAIWQNHGEISVIAEDGTVIDRRVSKNDLHLPVVVGQGANLRVKEYTAILEQSGALRSRIRAAIFVSERRWTLKLDNGLDVRLPEQNIPEALARLARLEREQRILQRDVLAIDLRLPDRLTLRLTEEAASALQESRKKPSKGGNV